MTKQEIESELAKLLNLQREIEAQVSEQRAKSLAGEIARSDFERWKSSAMRAKKNYVRRYRELREELKEINRVEFALKPSEQTLLLREISETLLDIRDVLLNMGDK